MYQNPYHTADLNNHSFLITGGGRIYRLGNLVVEYLVKFKARKIRVLDNLSTGYFT